MSHLYYHIIGCFERVRVQWTRKSANGSTRFGAKILPRLPSDSVSMHFQQRFVIEHMVIVRAIVSRVGIALACDTHVHICKFLQSRSLAVAVRTKQFSSKIQTRTGFTSFYIFQIFSFSSFNLFWIILSFKCKKNWRKLIFWCSKIRKIEKWRLI